MCTKLYAAEIFSESIFLISHYFGPVDTFVVESLMSIYVCDMKKQLQRYCTYLRNVRWYSMDSLLQCKLHIIGIAEAGTEMLATVFELRQHSRFYRFSHLWLLFHFPTCISHICLPYRLVCTLTWLS